MPSFYFEKKMEMKRRNIFEKRINLKPYEYPELLPYKDSISHAYWLWSEFNYTSDIQDYKTGITDKERNVITKSMLSIAQIEVTVKRFWSNLYTYFPKPEIDMVGVTFGDSEVRHQEAYAKLLELLGMDELFNNIDQFEPLMKRVRYMETFMENKDKGKQDFILSLILFSLFVEHISLYSQFYSIQSFNKHKNLFKGISNVISATFLEEDIHGNFGIALYKILKVEHSELFTDELYQNLIEMSKLAYDTEVEIVNWIFEEGDLSFITKEEVINYVKYRYAKSFINLGLDPIHEVDEELLSKSKWFELEQYTTKETDFFNKRSTDYAKKAKSITADDLF